MQECLFCKIIAGEIPSFKIYEDSETFAFLDINPAALGHTLVIPKKHAQDIFEINEQSIRAVAETTKRIACMLRKSLGADVTVLQNNGPTAGQAIAHLHVHVIPRRAGDRLPLAHMGPRASNEALVEIQKRIISGEAVGDVCSATDNAGVASRPTAQRAREALADWDRL